MYNFNKKSTITKSAEPKFSINFTNMYLFISRFLSQGSSMEQYIKIDFM
jgi:hypothetical protein